ncbi:MAG: YidC/Oxa1 family membrane protein insertase [Acetobacteraceae bacterium]|nr:YidC/Oxa1 family membrane protein insertase [Acetobacteraceae bacterium]
MNWLTDVMRQGMDLFYSWTGSYGVAIILLTLVVRIVLFPFTISQIRMTRRMQELQPRLKELQEKYKKDPQRLNRETVELWRRHKVNPLSGCLPALLQFPFLIALFRLLQGYHYAAGAAGFLWLADLSQPDRVLILPLLAAVTTWWQSKISTPGAVEGSQRFLMLAMPIFLGWMASRFAAGLSLYWVASNLLSIAQQYLMAPPVRARPARGETK